MADYVVRRGESLSAIAKRFGTTWQVLAQQNGLHDPDRLRVGQHLIVPGAPRPGRTGVSVRSKAPSALGAKTRATVSARSEAGLLETGAREARELWQSVRSTLSQLTTPSPAAPPARVATNQPASPVANRAISVAGDVTEAQLRAIMPDAGARTSRYVGPLNQAMRAHGINTNERRAAFLAQISVESGQLRHTEENLNYSAARLRAVWPRRFRTDAVAQRYDRDPEALANYVYADRLGNGDTASGDGWRYRGRGLMQTTGRDNYRAAGFENNPEALADPVTAADSAGRFWATNGLNGRTLAVLGRTQFNGVSRTVNGGDHGSAERWAAYGRALAALRPQED